MPPVAVQSIMTAAMAGGGIVFFGALYAIFYALGRQGTNPRFIACAFAGYLGLLACTVLLAHTLQWSGIWLLLAASLLIGYLIAPPLIWRLTLALHDTDDPVEANTRE
jgi:hypothetical protein